MLAGLEQDSNEFERGGALDRRHFSQSARESAREAGNALNAGSQPPRAPASESISSKKMVEGA